MTTTKKKDRCAALTSKGKDCKNAALEDSDYCGLHDNWDLSQKENAKADDETIGPSDPPTVVREPEDIEQQIIESHTIEPALNANPEFQKFEIAKRIAHTLSMSTLVPEAYLGRPNDCFVAINMGAELGLEPFQAIQSIAVIDNKPCLYGDGLIGVVRSSPLCMWIEETLSDDETAATCRTQRKGDPNPITATYSIDDAVRAGINNKFNWKKHPKRMLQMRARAYCLRDAYPDLLKGLGVVEERQDHDDSPPPVIEYELPKPPVEKTIADAAAEAITLAQVERAMHQSDTMEDLLKAADMAKHLPEIDQGTARITYKKMRDALRDDGNAAQT